jgi:hypothetical protein
MFKETVGRMKLDWATSGLALWLQNDDDYEEEK